MELTVLIQQLYFMYQTSYIWIICSVQMWIGLYRLIQSVCIQCNFEDVLGLWGATTIGQDNVHATQPNSTPNDQGKIFQESLIRDQN